jgi:hypothetical protein
VLKRANPPLEFIVTPLGVSLASQLRRRFCSRSHARSSGVATRPASISSVGMSMICPLIVPDRDSIDHVGVATHLITHPSSYPSIIIEY